VQRLSITKTLNNFLTLSKNNTYYLNQSVTKISNRLLTHNYLVQNSLNVKTTRLINQQRYVNQMKVTQISHNRLAEILEQSTIVDTINTDGLLSHTIQHPTLGKCQTVMGNGDDVLLITENKIVLITN
jgi:hypothetical protein